MGLIESYPLHNSRHIASIMKNLFSKPALQEQSTRSRKTQDNKTMSHSPPYMENQIICKQRRRYQERDSSSLSLKRKSRSRTCFTLTKDSFGMSLSLNSQDSISLSIRLTATIQVLTQRQQTLIQQETIQPLHLIMRSTPHKLKHQESCKT